MKNWKIIIPFIILALLLAACGGSTGTVAEPPAAESATSIEELGPSVDVQTTYDVSQNENVLLIDVREQSEYDEKHIPNITLIPMSEIESRLDEIPTDKEIIVTCRSGNRSSQVTDFLRQNGFDNVHNMEGGIVAWEAAGFPVEK